MNVAKEIKDCLLSFGFETSVGGMTERKFYPLELDKKMVGGQIKFILFNKL